MEAPSSDQEAAEREGAREKGKSADVDFLQTRKNKCAQNYSRKIEKLNESLKSLNAHVLRKPLFAGLADLSVSLGWQGGSWLDRVLT